MEALGPEPRKGSRAYDHVSFISPMAIWHLNDTVAGQFGLAEVHGGCRCSSFKLAVLTIVGVLKHLSTQHQNYDSKYGKPRSTVFEYFGRFGRRSDA